MVPKMLTVALKNSPQVQPNSIGTCTLLVGDTLAKIRISPAEREAKNAQIARTPRMLAMLRRVITSGMRMNQPTAPPQTQPAKCRAMR